MKRRIISVIALLMALMFVFSIAGCQTVNTKKVVSIESVLEDGGFAYGIIRSKDASEKIEDAIKEFRTALRVNFNTTVKSNTDTKEYSIDTREILIGQTNRPESIAALKEITDNRVNNSSDFIIKVDGNKIVINAVTDEALLKAIEFFKENFCADKEAWSLLHTTYRFLYAKELDMSLHTIAGNDIKDYSIVVPRLCSRIVREQAEFFVKALETKAGIKINIVNDESEKGDKEILFGDTNRDESKNTAVNDGEYVIQSVGNKLVVKGSNVEATAAAGAKLVALYEKALAAKEPLTFVADYKLAEKFEAGENLYNLVFNDEFNGALNKNLWVDFGATYESVSCLGTPCRARKGEGVYTSNGQLVIHAKHEADDSFTHRQTSNVGTHFWKYGVYEFCVKTGVYPGVAALWFNSDTKNENKDVPSGYAKIELDLLEGFGKGNTFASNIHFWWEEGGHKSLDGGIYAKDKKYTLPKTGEMLADKYHMYSLQWDTDVLNFCVDGEVFFSFDTNNDLLGLGTDSYDQAYGGAIISNTMGAATYGDKWRRGHPDVSTVYVDYVRLYQKASDKGFSTVNLK